MLVQAASGDLTYVVQADATDEAALRQLGVADVRHAVVAIGSGTQSSILATATLADMGIPDIWAKAQTVLHAAHPGTGGGAPRRVPRRDMGQRVAHRVTGQMLEFIQIDESFALVETTVPADLAGRTLAGRGHPRGRRRDGGRGEVRRRPFTHPAPDTILGPHDLLLVAGDVAAVGRFAGSSVSPGRPEPRIRPTPPSTTPSPTRHRSPAGRPR